MLSVEILKSLQTMWEVITIMVLPSLHLVSVPLQDPTLIWSQILSNTLFHQLQTSHKIPQYKRGQVAIVTAITVTLLLIMPTIMATMETAIMLLTVKASTDE